MRIHLFTILGCGEEKKYYFDTDAILKNKSKPNLSVSPVSQTSAKYYPEKIVYTGVTVGGIHTGGFHRQEAYYKTRSTLTGNGILYIDSYSVSWIELSSQLAAVAKKDSRMKMNGNRILVQKPMNRAESAVFVSAVCNQSVTSQVNAANTLENRCYSVDYCKYVMNFLARAIDGEFLIPEKKKMAAQILAKGANPDHWIIGGNILATIASDEEARAMLDEIRAKIDKQQKYEYDGKVFYNRKEYDLFVSQEETRKKREKEKNKIFLISLIAACVLFALFVLIACL